MKLYELSEQYQELERLLEEGEDVANELTRIEDAIEAKGAAIVHVLRNLDLDIDKLDAELKRLQARKSAAVANKERLREYVRTSMTDAGVHRVLSNTFVVSLQKGNESVVIEDETLIPEQYWKVKREVAKSLILETWQKNGEIVPGTRVERGTKLVIR